MWESPFINRLLSLALAEDLSYGDITSELCVDDNIEGSGKVIAKDDFIVCGLPLIEKLIWQSGYAINVELKVEDGQSVKKGMVLVVLHGRVRDLLSIERTMLNFLQRLSGCATFTYNTVRKTSGLVIADTRKTTPGWRVLEKYAVRTGGGRNHRLSLSDMVLVKDNHIDANGGDVVATLKRVTDQKGIYTPFEVEVRSIDELIKALQFKPTAIMLDNMSEVDIAQSIKMINERSPQTIVEVSGGVGESQFGAYEELGVTLVSMGALTNRYQSVDISMDIEL